MFSVQSIPSRRRTLNRATQLLTTLFIFAICALTTQTAAANQFLFSLAAMKDDSKTEGPTITSQDNQMTAAAIKAGFILTNGIYLGGIYDSRTDQSGSAKIERASMGATVGYHDSGWYIDASFYLSSNRKNSSTEYKDGTGYGVDIGKMFPVADPLNLGLQICYRSFSYSKVGSTTETNKINSELIPMIVAALVF